MNRTNKGQPVPRLLGPRTRAPATAEEVRAGQKRPSPAPRFTPHHLYHHHHERTPPSQIKGTHR